MRHIPFSIREKLDRLRWTHEGDADPRINLVLQRTKRYIEEGGILTPYDLWERKGLGAIDAAYRREDRLRAPDYVYLAYIEQGQAHAVRQPYVASIEEKPAWEYLYPLGAATDVAVEFDGHWERTSPDADICFDSPAQWSLVTEGEPYFFIVSGGALTVRQGQGDPYTLAASGVSKVAALRAWKNVYHWVRDQGLLCGYIRDGKVRYRNWANQGSESTPLPPAWETERTVAELPYPAENVALFRTNDFRCGFICEAAGELHWAITDRNWAGMAIRDHHITAVATDLKIDFIEIQRLDFYGEHTITAVAVIDEISLLYAMPEYAFRYAENDGNTIIYAKTDHFLTDIDSLDFAVYDDDNQIFAVSEVVAGVDPRQLVLTVADLNPSNQSSLGQGDLTLHFLGIGDTRGEAGQAVDPFEITFTPEGLEFEGAGAPMVAEVWNE